MKIKTQFYLSLALFGTLLVVTAAVAWLTQDRIYEMDVQETLAQSVANDAAEMSYEANRYVFDPASTSRERWETSWNAAWEHAQSLEPMSHQQRTLTEAVRSDLRRQRAVFLEISAQPQGPRDANSTTTSLNRLSVQNASVAFDTQRLLRVIAQERRAVRNRFVGLTAVLLGSFVTYLLLNYYMVQRRWLNSLAALQWGAQVVGSGDLSFSIPVRQNDEIGELTDAFNKMTVDLRDEVASKAEVERERARFEALSRMGLSLASGVGLAAVLDAVCQEVLTATRHGRVTVSLLDEASSVMTVAVSGGESPIPKGTTFSWEELSEPARDAIGRAEPMLIDYDRLRPSARPAKDVASHAGYMAPLIYQDRLVGTLFVDDPNQRREFTGYEMELLKGAAAQAATAIENARLYEAERSIAETLQETLVVLPERVPGIKFSRAYESATHEMGRVGGDFYDVFEVQPGMVAISLGDVSGKGIGAAVTTSLVRAALRLYALDGSGAAEVVEKANNVLRRFTEDDTFVTLWFALFDGGSRELSYVGAGHPPALVQNANGEVLALESTDPFVGAYSSAEFSARTARLLPGNRLILYSDGVFEARAPDGEPFGETRLRELIAELGAVATEDLSSAIIERVREFTSGVLRDDAAVLVVEPVEPAEPPAFPGANA